MALSFTEKRALQKAIATNLTNLQAGTLSFADKRKYQKEIQDAFAKLREKLNIETKLDLTAALALLEGIKQFFPEGEYESIKEGMSGEEKDFFIQKVGEISKTIETMPKTREQDGKGDDAIVYLHYFKGGSDWYITEKDQEAEQIQAFGYVILGGDKQNAELGYINIVEITKAGVELDLYWAPKTIREIKGESSGEPSRIDQAYELGKQAFATGIVRAPAQDGKLMAMIPPGQEVGTGDTQEIMQSWTRGWDDANIAVPVPSQNQKLADLIAGKHNNDSPEAFLSVLKDIIVEINDIEPVKPPTISYIEANMEKIDAVMESALGEVFGKLWDKTTGFPGLKTPEPSPQPANDAVRIKPQDGDYGPPKKISIDIDDDFYGPAAFRTVIRAIEEARADDTVDIKINSNGGDTQSAQAIYVALLKTPAKTKAIIINAYSAGSVVAMACDEIEPTPFCTMMVHNASSWSGGKLGDLAGKAAFLNDYFGEWYQQLYAGFLTDEELKDIIKGQDFWLKEPQIRERLKNWKPIRQRLQDNGIIKAA